MTSRTLRPALAAAVVASLLAACGKKDAPAAGDTASPGASGTAAAPSGAAGGEQTPDAGGKVITVQMLTDEQGNNKFDPADFTARKGDVIRYTLKQGAHNAHFVADSNPGKTGLPPAGEILQLPGQTYDVKVTWAPGTYYYHCDPHALLGMQGHVTVQ